MSETFYFHGTELVTKPEAVSMKPGDIVDLTIEPDFIWPQAWALVAEHVVKYGGMVVFGPDRKSLHVLAADCSALAMAALPSYVGMDELRHEALKAHVHYVVDGACEGGIAAQVYMFGQVNDLWAFVGKHWSDGGDPDDVDESDYRSHIMLMEV